jgi:hypothetical protein
MPRTMPPRSVGILAGIVVVLAGAGAYLQSSIGGPGTLAFDVRLLLVSIAVVGCLILGLAVRARPGAAGETGPRPKTGLERSQ